MFHLIVLDDPAKWNDNYDNAVQVIPFDQEDLVHSLMNIPASAAAPRRGSVVEAELHGKDEGVLTYIGMSGHPPDPVRAAIALAVMYGGSDDVHHKAWVIDQMVRTLAGDDYEQVVADAKAGEDGPETYEWDEGIAP